MKRIGKVTRKIKGAQCVHCKRQIVETFKLQGTDTTNDNFLSYISNESIHPVSIGIGCQKCGLQYGEPVFSSMLPNKELDADLRHNLSLIEYKVKRVITDEDLHELMREKGLSDELKNLEDDDIVYVKVNEAEYRTFKGYISFYLSEKIGATEYNISIDCFE